MVKTSTRTKPTKSIRKISKIITMTNGCNSVETPTYNHFLPCTFQKLVK
jgi:hypothetical protein